MNEAKKKDILDKKKVIIVSMIVFALVAFVGSLFVPAKYKSELSLMVKEQQVAETPVSIDNDSNVFTQIVYTEPFFEDVQEAPFEVERDFSENSEEREEQWEEMVSVENVKESDILEISVLNTSRKTAEETAKAVAYTLATENEKYLGEGNSVSMSVVDGPDTPASPAVPNVWLNTFIGAILGAIMSVLFVYFSLDEIYLAKKDEHERKKENKNENKNEDEENEGAIAISFDDDVEDEVVVGSESEIGEIIIEDDVEDDIAEENESVVEKVVVEEVIEENQDEIIEEDINEEEIKEKKISEELSEEYQNIVDDHFNSEKLFEAETNVDTEELFGTIEIDDSVSGGEVRRLHERINEFNQNYYKNKG
ncbi:MAG: hypothetical protein ABFQ53_04065 [Patescibacteria group bacterium]